MKIHLREIGWGGGGVEWIHLAQDRDRWRTLMNAVMDLRLLAPRRDLAGIGPCRHVSRVTACVRGRDFDLCNTRR
jgi:hypothetical protein